MHATSQDSEAAAAEMAAVAVLSKTPSMILDLSTCVADVKNAVCVGGHLLPR